MCRYIIISPVKNEEKYLENTIRSVLAQTILPSRWVLVNDGSSDGTAAVISQFAEEKDWIIPVRLPQSSTRRKRGQGVIEAFYKGYERIQHAEYDYLVKLDGDLVLPADFFAKILERFHQDPRLGIASGVSYANKHGKWVRERAAKGYTFGETKVYRRGCFEEIGGLVPHMGWDGIDHIKAIMLGWNASSFDDIIFYHMRPEGTGTGILKAAVEEGVCCHYMGYHPLFFFLRSVKRMFSHPFLFGGLGMLFGFLRCGVTKQQQIEDNAFISFLRKNQMARLINRDSQYA
jgi:glycosyltransferase involved in cell wall biosynthesis